MEATLLAWSAFPGNSGLSIEINRIIEAHGSGGDDDGIDAFDIRRRQREGREGKGQICVEKGWNNFDQVRFTRAKCKTRGSAEVVTGNFFERAAYSCINAGATRIKPLVDVESSDHRGGPRVPSSGGGIGNYVDVWSGQRGRNDGGGDALVVARSHAHDGRK